MRSPLTSSSTSSPQEIGAAVRASAARRKAWDPTSTFSSGIA
jgi:hypothetical protein